MIDNEYVAGSRHVVAGLLNLGAAPPVLVIPHFLPLTRVLF